MVSQHWLQHLAWAFERNKRWKPDNLSVFSLNLFSSAYFLSCSLSFSFFLSLLTMLLLIGNAVKRNHITDEHDSPTCHDTDISKAVDPNRRTRLLLTCRAYRLTPTPAIESASVLAVADSQQQQQEQKLPRALGAVDSCHSHAPRMLVFGGSFGTVITKACPAVLRLSFLPPG